MMDFYLIPIAIKGMIKMGTLYSGAHLHRSSRTDNFLKTVIQYSHSVQSFSRMITSAFLQFHPGLFQCLECIIQDIIQRLTVLGRELFVVQLF